MLHAYVDPFACDPRDFCAREIAQKRHAIAVLEGELARLDQRIIRLERMLLSLTPPDPGQYDEPWDDDAYNSAEYVYEAEYNQLDWQISRLLKRYEHIGNTIWNLEESIYWSRA